MEEVKVLKSNLSMCRTLLLSNGRKVQRYRYITAILLATNIITLINLIT